MGTYEVRIFEVLHGVAALRRRVSHGSSSVFANHGHLFVEKLVVRLLVAKLNALVLHMFLDDLHHAVVLECILQLVL